MIRSSAETLSSYLTACESRDPRTIAGHFTSDARVIDPSGTCLGKEAVVSYFQSIYSDLDSLTFETGPVSWCGQSCAVSWKGKAKRKDGTTALYSGIDVFTFDESSSIRELWAFWTPEELLASDTVKQN